MRGAAMGLVAAAALCVGSAGAGAASAHAFCPGISGQVAYPKGGKVHVISLESCDESVARATTTARAVPGVRTTGARAAIQRIWVHGRPVFAQRTDGPVVPLRLSGDGRWLFFAIDPQASASIAADGLDLLVVSTRGGAVHHLGLMLPYPDYVTWCGGRLVYAQGPDRIATHAKRLLVAAPPGWRPRPLWQNASLSFASPTCDPDGRSVAVLAQRSSVDARFFDTHWALWRVGLDGSRTLLDRPPAGWADESPAWAPDGGALAFVREHNGNGELAVIVGQELYGPLAQLGYSLGFYGHHDWEVTWRT